MYTFVVWICIWPLIGVIIIQRINGLRVSTSTGWSSTWFALPCFGYSHLALENVAKYHPICMCQSVKREIKPIADSMRTKTRKAGKSHTADKRSVDSKSLTGKSDLIFIGNYAYKATGIVC